MLGVLKQRSAKVLTVAEQHNKRRHDQHIAVRETLAQVLPAQMARASSSSSSAASPQHHVALAE